MSRLNGVADNAAADVKSQFDVVSGLLDACLPHLVGPQDQEDKQDLEKWGRERTETLLLLGTLRKANDARRSSYHYGGNLLDEISISSEDANCLVRIATRYTDGKIRSL